MRHWLVKIWVWICIQNKWRKLRATPWSKFGNGSKIDLFTEIEDHVSVGDFCNICSSFIGRGTYITENSVLRHTRIGRFCSIADHVMSGMGTHPVRGFVSSHPAFFNPHNASGFSFCEHPRFEDMPTVEDSNYTVVIGNDVWIGSGVRILNKVRIGDGAVIGAGAVVIADVPPYSIYGGVPAKEIGQRFEAGDRDFLLRFQWWKRDMQWLTENATLFTSLKQFRDKFDTSTK